MESRPPSRASNYDADKEVEYIALFGGRLVVERIQPQGLRRCSSGFDDPEFIQVFPPEPNFPEGLSRSSPSAFTEVKKR